MEVDMRDDCVNFFKFVKIKIYFSFTFLVNFEKKYKVLSILSKYE